METSLGIQKMIAKTNKDDKVPPIVPAVNLIFSSFEGVCLFSAFTKERKSVGYVCDAAFLKKCRLWRRKKKQQT